MIKPYPITRREYCYRVLTKTNIMNAQELITILAQHPDAKIQYGYIDEYTPMVTHCEYVAEYNIFILS